jgi:phytoene dehydrogenase-like protein
MKHTLPGGFVSLLTTGLLGLPGKFEVARLLSGIHRIDAAAARHTAVAKWLERSVRQPDVRRLLQALFRVATYTHAPQRQSAGAAIAQLQMALSGNVLYLDGGWQTLVDGLRTAAAAAGVRIVTATRVEAVECDGAVRGVRLAGGARLPAAAVVVAGSPEDAVALVPPQHAAVLRDWAAAAVPVRVACLDAGLARLSRPRGLFALGIDRPLYLSVHSAVAKLAPPGGAMVLVGKYLDPDADDDAGADLGDLEALLDAIQPGWRDVVVERRFLPSLTVSHALVTAAAGGTAGRPGPAVPNVSGLYVAGDWVGAHGMLADAALVSAKRAAQQIAAAQARLAAA